MKCVAFAVPGSLDTPTGGYAYDKRMIAELRALGWQVDVIDLGDTFPNPDMHVRATALAKLQAVAAGQPIVLDGLAFGVMAAEAAALHDDHPLVALVHHPLALETGLDPAAARALHESELAALACTQAVIVTSPQTAEIVCRDFAVPAARITIAQPAVDRATPSPRPRGGSDSVHLLAVGSITPRKGYDILMDALGGLKDLPWHLTIAGEVRSDAAFARLTADIARLELQDRVALIGGVDRARLEDLYASADLFVLASLFEGYGMVFAEAIAHGLPLVVTDVGAARDVVPAGAGLLVPPGDARAFGDALRQVVTDAGMRRGMAAAAHEAATRLPQWRDSASAFARVLEALT